MSDSLEVHRVITQVRAPNGKLNDHGQVCEGRYTLADGKVTLTDVNGKPVRDAKGNTYSRKIEPGGNAKAVAAKLTREFRLVLLGKTISAAEFSRPIEYPKSGII